METMFVDEARYSHWLRDHPEACVAKMDGRNGRLVLHEASCEEASPGEPVAGGMASVRLCVESADDLVELVLGRRHVTNACISVRR
jgi:hypothetical protein